MEIKDKVLGWLCFRFDSYTKSGKTTIWNVYHKDSDEFLGSISWSGNWRQYTFNAESWTYYSAGCMISIVIFLKYLNSKGVKTIEEISSAFNEISNKGEK